MTELRRAIIEGVECVLIPYLNAPNDNIESTCGYVRCPRFINNRCTDFDLKTQRDCYRPYDGYWSPIAVYATLRLTGEINA